MSKWNGLLISVCMTANSIFFSVLFTRWNIQAMGIVFSMRKHWQFLLSQKLTEMHASIHLFVFIEFLLLPLP